MRGICLPPDWGLPHVGLDSTIYSLDYEEGLESLLDIFPFGPYGVNSPYGLEPYDIEPCGTSFY